MMDTCEGCEYSVLTECKRFPPTKDGYPLASKGCGEFKSAPVVEKEPIKPIEEKKSIYREYDRYPVMEEQKEKVEEKSSNPFNPPTGVNDLHKRGWPKGRPRK